MSRSEKFQTKTPPSDGPFYCMMVAFLACPPPWCRMNAFGRGEESDADSCLSMKKRREAGRV